MIVQKKALFPATDDGLGFFKVATQSKRFCLDVGHNEGNVMVADWHKRRGEDMFAIGVEANPYLFTLFDSITTEDKFPADFEGRWWHTTTEKTAQLAIANARTYRRARERGQLLLIHAAVSHNRTGVLPFNPGFGWRKRVEEDVGSLFEWTDKTRNEAAARHRIPVASLRLDEVLARVPPRLWFDTLKVDIQGADADALLSAGAHLERFACVVGEFRANHYKIPKGVVVNPREILIGAGFHMVGNSMREKVWVNRRFLGRFATRGNYTCNSGEGIPGSNRTSVSAEDKLRHDRFVGAVRCIQEDPDGSQKRCAWSRSGWFLPIPQHSNRTSTTA